MGNLHGERHADLPFPVKIKEITMSSEQQHIVSTIRYIGTFRSSGLRHETPPSEAQHPGVSPYPTDRICIRKLPVQVSLPPPLL
jgi:hypothetical protein